MAEAPQKAYHHGHLRESLLNAAEEALAELAEPGAIIATLAERLEARGTDYAGLLSVLSELAGGRRALASDSAPLEDPDDLVALDAAWAEEEITFGAMAPTAPGAAPACPQAQAMVSRMLEPATTPSTPRSL